MSTAPMLFTTQHPTAFPTTDDPLIGHFALDPSEIRAGNLDHHIEAQRQERFNELLAPYTQADGDTYVVIQTVWDDQEITYTFAGLILEGDHTADYEHRLAELADFAQSLKSGSNPYTSLLDQGTDPTRLNQHRLLFCVKPTAEGFQVTSGQTKWASNYEK